MPDSVAAKDIFLQALEIDSPEERAVFLSRACGDDSDLRRRVEALLSAHDEPQSFLERPAVNFGDEATADFHAAGKNGESLEGPGIVIGHYKLLQEIGRGGFGIVYMAEQEEPVRRQVALKIIKPGMDTREVIARFEAERQALALMDHPHIAKVLDAGATSSGRPYFVMELVKGVPITEFCDKNNLSTRQRLELFIPVCQAVQHAHLKGVIHRDLKPSNVMVTLHDGKPVPKVIDFGISKAISQRLTEKTLFTRYGQMVGTPQYMSPEQAEMSGLDVDTRSDIYSLGVLLYELLTGSTPLDASSLREAGYAEILRMIQEVESPKPSTRLSTLRDELTVVCKHRGTNEKQIQLVKGELDWIVMKALDKDRNRRYETASAFAEDVERHLRDEAVIAGPPTAGYRMRKFVRRRKGLVATGAAIAATLLIGLGLATIGFVQAQRERDAAELARAAAVDAQQDAEKRRIEAAAQQKKAEEEAERANAVVDLLNEMLATANPLSSKGADYTVRQMLDDFLQGIDDKLQGHPLVEAEVRQTIGQAYSFMWQHDKGVQQLRTAADLYRRHAGDRSLEHAKSLTNLAWALHRKAEDRGPISHPFQEMGLAEAQRAAEILRDRSDGETGYAFALFALSNMARETHGDLERSETLLRQAIELLADKTDTESKALRGDMLTHLADVLLQRNGSTEESERLAKEGVSLLRDYRGRNHPFTILGLSVLGDAQLRRRKFKDTEKSILEAKRALDSQRDLIIPVYFRMFDSLSNSLISDYRIQDAIEFCEQSLNRANTSNPLDYEFIANVIKTQLLFERGDIIGAERCIRDSAESPRFEELDMLQKMIVQNQLARVLVKMPDCRDEGQAIIRRQLPLLNAFKSARANDPHVLAAFSYCIAHLDAGERRPLLGRAIDSITSALANSRGTHFEMRDLLILANLREIEGNLEAANELLELIKEVKWPGHFQLEMDATDMRIRLLGEKAPSEQIEALHRNLLTDWQSECPENHPAPIIAQCRLADFLVSEDRLDEAAEILQSAQAECDREGTQADSFHRRTVLASRIKLAEAKGESQSATQLQLQLDELIAAL